MEIVDSSVVISSVQIISATALSGLCLETVVVEEDPFISDQYAYLPMPPPPLAMPSIYPTYVPSRPVTFAYNDYFEREFPGFSGNL